MAPRGMSAEEKKAVVLEVFRAAEAPFSMKEIEKAAGAKKGLHPMAIKELVVELANDGKVRGEGVAPCPATSAAAAAPRPVPGAPPPARRGLARCAPTLLDCRGGA